VLLVEAQMGPSAIHGMGLIAQQFIPKGAMVWEYTPELDLTLSREELDALPERARRAFLYWSYQDVHSGEYILCFDDARYFNHSDDPNTDGCRALRDIAPGEEITYDYRRWDLDHERKLGEAA